MNLKRLGFWAFLFCVLLMVVLLTDSKKPDFEIVEETPMERVFDIRAEDINKIRIVFEGRETEIVREKSGWKITEPEGANLRSEQIESLFSSVANLVVADVVVKNPEKISQYGLAPPQSSVIVEGKDRKITLLIGNLTPTSISMYALIKEQNKVIQIGNYIRFSIRTFIDNVY